MKLEDLNYYPDGSRVLGRYVQWPGRLYDVDSRGNDVMSRYRDAGEVQPG